MEAHPDLGRDILDRVEPRLVEAVISDVTVASRKLCLAILVGLLVGHASVALHTAAHAGSDGGECGICVSYGGLSKAVSADPAGFLSPSKPAYLPAPTRNGVDLRASVPVRQRGPPAPI